ncbi:hypothetical protein SARC_06903 [Sphaeroforma arctica JP610]|uniref:VTC domain-containing protein n=1 Tax=Sphaeroforma arctica JP610 TaxID=667725 RepID=A0A0L0FW07_9EUKA|nr:hypothetical protein SARC_06903 [Sphaeroforma arctica JP610]KNC80746.1 hypothetical protein SARC_06903 [Sphaeroforma arctica JP610]|eukprot:XP_014154648.1 hypothetical protein SARC_06903 [Sphaeroforma arctica JP610]
MSAIIEMGSTPHNEQEEQVFVRKSIKYVLPNDSVEAFIGRVEPKLPVSPFILPSGEVVTSQMNNSCYFDDDYLNMFKERVVKNEGAELYRVRWYGTSLKPVEDLFIERKRHHNYKQVHKYSNKKRLELPKEEMDRFLVGAPIEELNASKDKLAGDIQAAMVNLRPKIRTQYLRTSLMSGENKDLRITLDRDIMLFTEPQSWAEIAAADGMGQGRGVKMPFTVVEVKVAMVEGGRPECPDWIHTALMECNARKIKLSKYGYGCIQFFPMHAHPSPKWKTEVETWSEQLTSKPADITRAISLRDLGMLAPPAASLHVPTNGSNSNRYSDYWKDDSSQDFATVEIKSVDCNEKPLKKSSGKTRNIFRKAKRHGLNRRKYGKTDGKAFMANERTFLNYIQWTSSLATFCVGLLQIATGNEVLYVSSAIIAFCDVLIAYATIIYHLRRIYFVNNITSKGGRVPRSFNEWKVISTIMTVFFIAVNSYIIYLWTAQSSTSSGVANTIILQS